MVNYRGLIALFFYFYALSFVYSLDNYPFQGCTFCNVQTGNSFCNDGRAVDSGCNVPLPEGFVGISTSYAWISNCICEIDPFDCPKLLFDDSVCSFEDLDVVGATIISGTERFRVSSILVTRGASFNPSACSSCLGLKETSTRTYSEPCPVGSPELEGYLCEFNVCECSEEDEDCYVCDESGCYQCLSWKSFDPLKNLEKVYSIRHFIDESRMDYDGDGNEILRYLDHDNLHYLRACNPEKGCSIYNDCPGDINNDMQINQKDLAIFFENWLRDDCSPENACCNGADINGDGFVDMQDYSIIAENFGARCLD